MAKKLWLTGENTEIKSTNLDESSMNIEETCEFYHYVRISVLCKYIYVYGYFLITYYINDFLEGLILITSIKIRSLLHVGFPDFIRF